MHHVLDWVVEPGFWASPTVHVALALGSAAAVLSGVVGTFTVVRGQSFAGHAVTDVAGAGGAGALVVGVDPVVGFVAFGLFAAGVMDLIGVRLVRGRDLATGVVLGASTGLTALALYLVSTSRATTGATQQILFGSIFTVDTAALPAVIALSVAALAAVGALYRPLLLSALSPDMARARGVPDRLVGAAFLGAVSVAVGVSAVAIGAVRSTALLVGPAATALRLTSRMGRALVVASAVGVVSTCGGVLLAYDSYAWGSSHRALPVSFFVVVLVVLGYLASGARRRSTSGATRRAPRASPGSGHDGHGPRGAT